MTNPLYSIERFPATSQAALREFLENYIAVLGGSVPSGLAAEFGDIIPTRSGYATFPVTQIGTRYQRWMGEDHFKTMQSKSFDIKTSLFQAGYEAPWLNLQRDPFVYRQWQAAPAQLVEEEGHFRDEAVAALLEDGETVAGYPDGQFLFDTAHPANIFDASAGTWSNLESGTTSVLSIPNIEAQIAAMKVAVKDHLGRKMGVKPDTIIVPTEKEEQLVNLLKQGMIIRGAADTAAPVDNPYKSGLRVFGCKELTDVNDWYLVDSSLAKQLPPWISLREDLPPALATAIWDESSDYFKNTKNIKFSSTIGYGFGLAFPHAIRKIPGA